MPHARPIVFHGRSLHHTRQFSNAPVHHSTLARTWAAGKVCKTPTGIVRNYHGSCRDCDPSRGCASSPCRHTERQVTVHPLPPQGVTLAYSANKMLGKGSFGEVFDAVIQETGQHVAVKRVMQDKRFKVSSLPPCDFRITRPLNTLPYRVHCRTGSLQS